MGNITKQQVPKLLGKLVEFQDSFLGMSKEDAQWIIQNTKQAIKLFVEAVKTRLQNKNYLIDFKESIKIPQTIGKFIAKEKFVVNLNEDAKVKIAEVGVEFKARFFRNVEEVQRPGMADVYIIQVPTLDYQVISCCGGDESVELFLQDIWGFLAKQPNGEGGSLSLNEDNVFYARASDNTLLPVHVVWLVNGWVIRSCPYPDVYPLKKDQIMFVPYK